MSIAQRLVEKFDPHPFWVIRDRYGGAYSRGAYTCFWNSDYPDDVLAGDTECMMIWDRLYAGEVWGDVQLGARRCPAFGVGATIEEAILDAAKRAGVAEKDGETLPPKANGCTCGGAPPHAWFCKAKE